MAIAEILPAHDTSLSLVELRHRRRESALHQLVQSALTHHWVRHAELLEHTLLRRERLGSTSLGRGHAVSGAWSLCVEVPCVLLGLSENGLEWEPGAAPRVHLVALVLTPGEQPHEFHARRLAAMVNALRLQRTRQRILERRDTALAAMLLREVPK